MRLVRLAPSRHDSLHSGGTASSYISQAVHPGGETAVAVKVAMDCLPDISAYGEENAREYLEG